MKKSLQDKLKKYGTMAAATVGGVASADAQIVYTDVSPDSTFCNDGDSYNLDLNNDLTNDFTINLNKSSNSGGYYTDPLNFNTWQNIQNSVRLTPLSSNSVIGSVSALSYGAAIGSSATGWQNGSSLSMGSYSFYYSRYASTYTSTYYTNSQTYTNTYTWGPYTWGPYSSTFGNWPGQTDKYLGLKIVVGANTHYGWARLDVSSDVGCVTIKDYAYEMTPNTPINAGDMGVITSVSQQNIQGVKVFAANDVLNLKVPADVVGFNIRLVDVLGRTVVSETIATTSSTIDVSKQSNGVYIVLIEGQGRAFAQKITIN